MSLFSDLDDSLISPTHDVGHNKGGGEEHQEGEKADHDDEAGRLVPRLHRPQAEQLVADPPRGAQQGEGGQQPDQDGELAPAVERAVAVNSLEQQSEQSFSQLIT